MLYNFNILTGMDVSYAVDCGLLSVSTVDRITYVHLC